MNISRKIAPHLFYGLPSGLPVARADAKPTVIKVVDPSLTSFREVRAAVGPECLIIIRFYWDHQVLDDPEAAARAWWERDKALMLAIAGEPNVVIEGFNEIPDDLIALHVRMELERVRILHAHGLNVAVMSKGVGEPREDLWPQWVPVLKLLGPRDVIAVHEYWVDHADIDNRWHVARLTLPEIAPYVAGLRWVVTEAGRDVVEKRGSAGYQLSTNDEGILADMVKAGVVYDACDACVGVTMYQIGSLDGVHWGAFNLWSVWGRVVPAYPAGVGPIGTLPHIPEMEDPVVTLKLVSPIAGTPNVTWTFIPPKHHALDLSMVVGTRLYAPVSGKVYVRRDTAANGGFGLYLRFETANGDKVYLAHMDRVAVIDEQRVEAGEFVGWSGNSGNSTAPHLHIEVRRAAGSAYRYGAVDPWPLIDWSAQPVTVGVGATIAEAMQKHLIPLMPTAALERAGAALRRIAVSCENRISIEGTWYVAQTFRTNEDRDTQFHGFCVEGDWDNVRWFIRKN